MATGGQRAIHRGAPNSPAPPAPHGGVAAQVAADPWRAVRPSRAAGNHGRFVKIKWNIPVCRVMWRGRPGPCRVLRPWSAPGREEGRAVPRALWRECSRRPTGNRTRMGGLPIAAPRTGGRFDTVGRERFHDAGRHPAPSATGPPLISGEHPRRPLPDALRTPDRAAAPHAMRRLRGTEPNGTTAWVNPTRARLADGPGGPESERLVPPPRGPGVRVRVGA
jgi:hypothetical protein